VIDSSQHHGCNFWGPKSATSYDSPVDTVLN